MCFLAYVDKEIREFYLKQEHGLKEYSREEIDAIEREVENIRENGYSITYGEYIKGICGIAAPIFTNGSNVELSIELIGFTSQYDLEELRSKGMLLKTEGR